MSGGRFLVGLYEVLKSENIIKILTLFKYSEFNDLKEVKMDHTVIESVIQSIVSNTDPAQIPALDPQLSGVVQYVSGYAV